MTINHTIDQDYIAQLEERERQLKFILNLKEKNSTCAELRDVVNNITKATLEYFDADGCNYNTIYEDKITVNPSIYNKMSIPEGNYKLSQYPKFISLLKVGKVFYIEDINSTDQFDENLRLLLLENRIVSCLVAPIKKNTNIVGFFSITQTRARSWTYEQTELIKEISLLTWSATEIIEKEKEKENFISLLREKEEWLSTIIDCMDANILVTNSLGEINLIAGNDKETFNTEFHKKSIVELCKHLDFFTLDGVQATIEDITLDRSIKGKTVVSEGIVHNKKTHESMYRQCRASPIKNKDGEITGAVVISTDIKERIKMEQALKKSEVQATKLVEELKKVDELRIGFLSSLSHELRNPLATISLGLSLMDYTEGNMEEQRKIRETLKRQTKQLTRLVDDLLNMTRITQNKFELSLETMEINTLLKEIVKDNDSNLNEKKIEIEANIPKESIIIEGDRSRLIQVIENILNNALKFTPEDGKIMITLKKDQITNKAIISIKDTGKGIPPDILENIFEPYVQARNDQRKSYAGLGIGLSIVKDIVERHKGNISAISEGENKGTEIIIRLPIL